MFCHGGASLSTVARRAGPLSRVVQWEVLLQWQVLEHCTWQAHGTVSRVEWCGGGREGLRSTDCRQIRQIAFN